MYYPHNCQVNFGGLGARPSVRLCSIFGFRSIVFVLCHLGAFHRYWSAAEGGDTAKDLSKKCSYRPQPRGYVRQAMRLLLPNSDWTARRLDSLTHRWPMAQRDSVGIILGIVRRACERRVSTLRHIARPHKIWLDTHPCMWVRSANLALARCIGHGTLVVESHGTDCTEVRAPAHRPGLHM